MTDVEKEIILSIFSRFERDNYIGEAFDALEAIQVHGRLPLVEAVRKVSCDMIRRTEYILIMQNGGGSGDEGKLS